MTSPTRKRGRRPRTFTHSDGTQKTLSEFGISRKQASDWGAIASLPEDVFEAALAKGKPTTQGLVRLACELATTNRKAPMRDPPTALELARKALAKLTRADRIIIARELLGNIADEGA